MASAAGGTHLGNPVAVAGLLGQVGKSHNDTVAPAAAAHSWGKEARAPCGKRCCQHVGTSDCNWTEEGSFVALATSAVWRACCVWMWLYATNGLRSRGEV